MNPSSSGPSASVRSAEAGEALDRFASAVGLPVVLPPGVEDEARRYLDLGPESLRKLSGSDCGEGAYMLERLALHIQDACNREAARVRWADETVRKLIAPRLAEQRAYSFEERRLLAVGTDPEAARVDALRVKAQLRVDRVSYMAGKVEAMARTLMALQQSKRGKNE